MTTKEGPQGQSVHQETLERVSDAVVAVDSDLHCQYLNSHAEELLGKDRQELLGEIIWDAFPDAKESIAAEKIEQALETQKETRYQRYNESAECWFEVRVFPDEDGVSIFFSDVTEKRERQNELERYEWLIENLPVAVGQTEVGTEEGFTYVNERLVEMFDLESKEAARQHPVSDYYANPEALEDVTEQLRANDAVHDYELELTTADGERFWGSTTATIDTIGDTEYFLGIVQDISERKAYEQKLNELHDATREMVAATTPEEVAQIVTENATELIGFQTNGVHLYDDAVGGLVPVSVSEQTRDLIGEPPVLDDGLAWSAFQSGESQLYNDLTAADGLYSEETPFESELFVPLGDHGVFIASATEAGAFDERDVILNRILADNAERAMTQLQTEQQLRERERELERAAEFLEETKEIANVGSWEVGLEADIAQWSDEVYRIHGLPLDTAVGVHEAIEFYHPADRDSIREAFETLTRTGEPYDLELRLIRADGEMRWIRTRGEPWYEDGDIVGARGTIQDITERKERERALEQQNDRLSEFAQIISHDLRNPLNVAQSRTELLQQVADGESVDHLQPLTTALDRMETIIEDTLTLARKGRTVGEVDQVRIVDVVGKCWRSISTTAATLDVEDEFTIHGDQGRLKHVFENLFRNAVEHGGDDVTVSVGRTGEGGFYVEDDGPGIPPADREEIFEVGQTSTQDGTGFGLAIVRRIAEAHDWAVSVTEGRDGGARFEFRGVEIVEG